MILPYLLNSNALTRMYTTHLYRLQIWMGLSVVAIPRFAVSKYLVILLQQQ